MESDLFPIDDSMNYKKREEKARDQFDEKYIDWITKVDARVRKGLSAESFLLRLKRVKDEGMPRCELLEDKMDSAPYSAIAFLCFKLEALNVEIEVTQDHEILSPNKLVSGGEVRFHRIHAGGEERDAVAAIEQARGNYEKACEQWTESYVKKLGSRLIYADCGVPTRHMKAESDQFGWMSYRSKGTIYFTRE